MYFEIDKLMPSIKKKRRKSIQKLTIDVIPQELDLIRHASTDLQNMEDYTVASLLVWQCSETFNLMLIIVYVVHVCWCFLFFNPKDIEHTDSLMPICIYCIFKCHKDKY